MLGQNPELKTLRNSAYSSPRGCFGWVQSYISEAEAEAEAGAGFGLTQLSPCAPRWLALQL